MSRLLLRHTRLTGHEGRCYGRWEASLAPTFPEEVARVRAELPWTPEVIWTSPAQRCRRLADELNQGVPVHVDERLAELHFGEWEGRPWSELSGSAVEAWMAAPWSARPPGGEMVPELLARVADFREYIRNLPTERVLIITHAGVIRAWRSLAEKRPFPDTFNDTIYYGGLYPAD